MIRLKNFTQGDTPLFQVPITVSGQVQNLNGYEALFTITPDINPTSDDDAVVSINYTFGATGNTASFQTTQTQTAAMKANTPYYWSVKLKDPSGVYFVTIASGTVQANQSYTIRTS